MAEVEKGPPSIVRAGEQVRWQDPETGYIRRVLSPPHPNLKGELVEISLPANASVSYEASYFPGLEHHLWMLEGALSLEIDVLSCHSRTKTRKLLGEARYFPRLPPGIGAC